MRWIADFVYFLAILLYLPVLLYQVVWLKKNRHGWGERFGGVRSFDPNRPRIWVHAVSLGEVNATPKLISGLRAKLPDFDIVVSTTTDTGFARAVQLYGRESVFRFPLDFSWAIRRVLNRVNPAIIVLVELEVWYNLVRMSAARGIPIVVVNGRLTARSLRRFRRLGSAGRSMFGKLTWVGAQDETIAERFRQVGVPAGRIEVTSSMKWDTAQVAERIAGDDLLARALGIDGSRHLWVCGSTGDGEERIILDAQTTVRAHWADAISERTTGTNSDRALRPPILCLVPRKPERFDEVASDIQRASFQCRRRSRCPDGTVEVPCSDTTVLLGDTLGELRKFYALANVVFVGRSLVPMGGSDPIEAAALRKPVIVGPHMENFEEPVSAFVAADGLCRVASAPEIARCVINLLLDPIAAAKLGERAQDTVRRRQGAAERTVERLVRLLQTGSG